MIFQPKCRLSAFGTSGQRERGALFYPLTRGPVELNGDLSAKPESVGSVIISSRSNREP